VADGLNPAIVGIVNVEPLIARNPRDRAIRSGSAHGCCHLFVPWLTLITSSIPRPTKIAIFCLGRASLGDLLGNIAGSERITGKTEAPMSHNETSRTDAIHLRAYFLTKASRCGETVTTKRLFPQPV
jgi:hypothetical protein